ncbi:hypothetical protein GGR53DRAFT_480537 [Hypoxylon sp. FL1150]|nr:hypothetical protein GGR53DRAFT_480537 [Hypoxylon sp. FL1150]
MSTSAPAQPTNAAPAAATPAVDHPSANGQVGLDGKFHCREPGCKSRVANNRHSISTHLTIKHNPNSLYGRKAAINPHVCGACRKSLHNFHTFLAHVRNTNPRRRGHNYKGPEADFWRQWIHKRTGGVIQVAQWYEDRRQ